MGFHTFFTTVETESVRKLGNRENSKKISESICQVPPVKPGLGRKLYKILGDLSSRSSHLTKLSLSLSQTDCIYLFLGTRDSHPVFQSTI